MDDTITISGHLLRELVKAARTGLAAKAAELESLEDDEQDHSDEWTTASVEYAALNGDQCQQPAAAERRRVTVTNPPSAVQKGGPAEAGPVSSMDIIVDLENRSALKLTTVPAYEYAKHPTTSLLCIGWQIIGKDTILSWAPGDNDTTALDQLHQAIAKGANVHAWNSPFDCEVWNRVQSDWPPIPLQQQHDIAARARMCGLPGGLEKAAAALGLADTKHKEGKNALRYLMQPRSWSSSGEPIFADDPKRLALVRDYNTQDVRLTAKLYDILPELPDEEREIWEHDQKVNARGFRIDPAFLRIAGPFYIQAQRDGDARMRQATGGKVRSVSSVKALGTWLQSQGVNLRNGAAGDDDVDEEDDEDDGNGSRKGLLSKASVREALQRPGLPAAAREALEVRQDYGRSSVSKLVALACAVSSDHRLRGSLVYHGTLTGRQVARLFQPQNLPRDSYPAETWPSVLDDMRGLDLEAFRKKRDSAMDALVRLLRGAIVPADGCELVIGDFATVELRVLAWLAGQSDLVDALARGAKIYEQMAARVYQVPVASIKKDSEQRTLGKVGVLSCGYGAGWASLIKISRDSYQLVVDEPLARAAVDGYRTAYPRIPQLWRELETAGFDAIETPGIAIPVCGGRAALKMTRNQKWLGLQLPSGRWVRLREPKIIMDDRGGRFDPRPTLSVMGLDIAHRWIRQTLWGGILTAYLVSATARDFLVAAALRCERRGWKTVLQVHDELVIETPIGSVTAAMLDEEMSRSPAWAAGCPIETECAVRNRYSKE